MTDETRQFTAEVEIIDAGDCKAPVRTRGARQNDEPGRLKSAGVPAKPHTPRSFSREVILRLIEWARET